MRGFPRGTARRARNGVALALALTVAAPLATGGCAYFEDLFSKEEIPLPGTRIAILANQRTLAADPGLKDHQILLPAPSPNPDWPQPGGYPNHAMHHIQVPENIGEAWSTDVGKGSDDELRILGSPATADGRVFSIDSESELYAVDLKSGQVLWHTDLTPKSESDDGLPSGGVAVDSGRVYVATGFGHVVAVDAATGKEVWRTALTGPMHAAPTVRGGRVFVVTLDNRTFALDANTGQQLWDHSGITESASLLGGASPAVDQGVVVVPYSSGELVALRAENGRLLWSDSLASLKRSDIVSALSHIRGRPVIDRGRVVAISHSGIMAAYDLRTGRRIWERDIGGIESPWVAGDYIFILTNDAEVAAISRDTGGVYWVRPLPRFKNPEKQKGPIVWTGPILASDRLIVAGSHGAAWAMSPYSGKFIGEVKMPDGISVPPIVADGRVIFLSDDAELIVYQ
ncbi:MAG: pyrrolo-quinoline quinone [Rhodospirillales bacterium CG15_BIG_FIL_POST_REV_8_21_14_020_66_15]|nr:MAG: pyrrolo-quinoline quinone [Rhodospirillales bacterium CG15_BIG_FIL_POST_REV_8_21_14_020_66_15]